MTISTKNELELTKNILMDLLEKITEFYKSLSSISILNMNFENPPEPSISDQSREWVIFKDECLDFIEQLKNYVDTEGLEKNITINTSVKYRSDITDIERELKKIERKLNLLDLKEIADMNKDIKCIEENKKVKLFISHSTGDLPYIKYFVELLEDLGFDEDDLFCSSFREYGVPLNKDIYEYLKQQFNDNDLIVIFMLSNNYYRSVACLNEMGAAWILQSEYYSILLPGFDFNKIEGAINPNKISIKLDNTDLSSFLNDLKYDLCNKFAIKISDNKWERVRNDFVKKIHNEMEEKQKLLSQRLIQTNVNIDSIENFLADEIQDNLKKIKEITNYVNGIAFNFLDILNNITKTNFSRDFYQPLVVVLEHSKYDLYQKELVSNGTQEAKEIINLYRQFKMWNDKEDLHYFTVDEYAVLRDTLLRAFNKYYKE